MSALSQLSLNRFQPPSRLPFHHFPCSHNSCISRSYTTGRPTASETIPSRGCTRKTLHPFILRRDQGSKRLASNNG
ncbi:hypothetical protein GE061_018894 [Apolygus lucorum]|uniref:Uncharacterized protein n=1 Tax=Apolygus lucorum TaxID=248454 RepID=A0A6A4J882_APOLU|nr:hypothetical protein GE061_018894 [Apolygus lucorum]